MARARRSPRHLPCGFAATLLAACSFDAASLPAGSSDGPIAGPDGSVRPDASADARQADAGNPDAVVIDATPGKPDAPQCWPWIPTNFDPCNLPPSNGTDAQNVGFTLDTDTGVVSHDTGGTGEFKSALVPQADGTSIRVFVFDDFHVNVPMRFVGSHPVLIVATGSVEISAQGRLDFSAVVDDRGISKPGAGGDDPTACAASHGLAGESATTAIAGGGGGGGGAFGAGGGHGGAGSGTGSGGSASGGAPSTDDFSPLRGGCPGGTGGNIGAPGFGASSGGALQLAVRETLTITGGVVLRASGAGGQGAAARAGGGGGGSGGLIFLEAGMVRITPGSDGTPAICANGGSGGEGGGGSQAQSGNGTIGSCDPTLGATTPDRSLSGGNGGSGGFRGAPTGASGLPAAPGTDDSGVGGGGGGGGVGRVRIRSALAPAVVNAIVTPTAE
jgi:hypothetical protein